MNTAVVSAIVKPDGVFTIKPAPFIKTDTKRMSYNTHQRKLHF